jgi:hypothetical protein
MQKASSDLNLVLSPRKIKEAYHTPPDKKREEAGQRPSWLQHIETPESPLGFIKMNFRVNNQGSRSVTGSERPLLNCCQTEEISIGGSGAPPVYLNDRQDGGTPAKKDCFVVHSSQ